MATKRMPPNAGKGRPKGVPNKLTGKVRAMVEEALDAAGGADYLVMQAYAEPAAFLSLVGKLIPTQIGGDPDGVPIAVTDIVRTVVTPPKRK